MDTLTYATKAGRRVVIPASYPPLQASIPSQEDEEAVEVTESNRNTTNENASKVVTVATPTLPPTTYSKVAKGITLKFVLNRNLVIDSSKPVVPSKARETMSTPVPQTPQRAPPNL
jgi:hypothetical protein